MAHGYTKHGHPCCGQARIGDRPETVARCGGSTICSECALDAARLHSTSKPSEGCCRAAVASEGFAHDHEEWYRDLTATQRELGLVNAELQNFGIEYPLGHRGVHDLASMADGRLEDLRAAEAQIAAWRPVIEAAKELPTDYAMGFLADAASGVIPDYNGWRAPSEFYQTILDQFKAFDDLLDALTSTGSTPP